MLIFILPRLHYKLLTIAHKSHITCNIIEEIGEDGQSESDNDEDHVVSS